MNELLLIGSLVVLYGAVLLWFYLFGTGGLMAFTVFATIAANIEVMILVDAFGMEMTLGNILFATTFLVTDILSEVAGKKEAQKAVWRASRRTSCSSSCRSPGCSMCRPRATGSCRRWRRCSPTPRA